MAIKETDCCKRGNSLLSRMQIEGLICNCFSMNEVMAFLSKEGVDISLDSVRNLSWALDIFRGVQKFHSLSFIVYGSTARGDAGLDSKVQEIQFWQGESFLGSAFRKYGESDLDVRCVAEIPWQIYKSLLDYRAIAKLPPDLNARVKIDSYDFVINEISDKKRPSFYRRILGINNPLILSGWERFEGILELSKKNLIREDIDYEVQMFQLRTLVRRRLLLDNVIFFPGSQLSEMFPVYYNPGNLKNKNIMRNISLRVSFGSQESSLIVVSTEGFEEIDEYLKIISTYPTLPFAEIKRFILQ